MLNSGIGQPYDPKTGKGSIGKNYCYQVSYGFSTAFFEDKEFNLYAGVGALGMEIPEFVGDNFDHSNENFIHGAGIRMFQFGARPIANNVVPSGTPNWGSEFKKQSIKYANSFLKIAAQGASMPHTNNYLDLDPTYKDAYGMPLLRMTYDYTEQDRELVKYMSKVTSSVAEAMGADRETSAVNSYLQMWDADNVFVVGASAFPHNSSFNPTGTIGALSYRAAEGIQTYLKQGGQLV